MLGLLETTLKFVTISEFIFIIIAILSAGFIRGFTGFGASLIIVMTLSVVFGPLIAVPIACLSGLPSMFQLHLYHGLRRLVLGMENLMLPGDLDNPWCKKGLRFHQFDICQMHICISLIANVLGVNADYCQLQGKSLFIYSSKRFYNFIIHYIFSIMINDLIDFR